MPVKLPEMGREDLGPLLSLLQDEVLTLQLETAEAEGGSANATEPLPAHRHTAFVDSNGNGITEPAEGHRHIVREWTVLEALGHDHGELDRDSAEQVADTEATARRYRAGAFELPTRLVDGEARFDEDNLVEGKPVQVLKVGTFEHPDSGEFEITEEFLNQLVDNSERFGRRIHFDYDHASEYISDNPDKTGKAAGWVKKLFRDGDTLWAVPLWTQPAYEAIQNGEWRYISAAFKGRYVKEGNEDLGPVLTSIAITNHPFLKDMEPIAANDKGEYRWLLMEAADDVDPVVKLFERAAEHKFQTPFTAEEVMVLYPDWEQEQAEAWVEAYGRAEEHCLLEGAEAEHLERADYDQEKACRFQAARIASQAAWRLTEENTDMKKLAEILGLSEDATEEQITEAVQALHERADAVVTAFKEALGLDEVPEDPKELVAAAEKGIEHRLRDSDPDVPDGMKLVDKEQLDSLERGAKQAEAATKRLTEMEAKERIRELKESNKIVSKSQEQYGRKLYTEQGEEAFKDWAETLDSNQELAELRKRSSHSQDPDHELSDEQQEAVKLFTDKVEELEKAGHSPSQAIRQARQQYPKLADRYMAAVEPEARV